MTRNLLESKEGADLDNEGLSKRIKELEATIDRVRGLQQFRPYVTSRHGVFDGMRTEGHSGVEPAYEESKWVLVADIKAALEKQE